MCCVVACVIVVVFFVSDSPLLALSLSLSLLQMMLHFALSQRLIESLAQRQIGLTLCTLQELFDLPCTGALWLIGLGRLCVIGLLWLLGNGGGGGWSSSLLVTGTAEHRCQTMADSVANCGANSDTSSSGSHLLEHRWLLWCCGHANGAWGGRCDGRWWWCGTCNRCRCGRWRAAARQKQKQNDI